MNKKVLDWETIDPLLGSISDIKISVMNNVSVVPIRSRRIALGIPAYARGQERDWAQIDALLIADVPIRDVSLRFNIRSYILYYRRKRKLGIIHPKPEPPCWQKIDPLLETFSDVELAREFNISEATVHRRRKKLGMPSRKLSKRINWDDIDPYIGTCPDRDIAKKAGVSIALIEDRRRRLNIPLFTDRVGSKEKINWKAIEPYLGTAPDKQLALKFNVGVNTIYRKRHKMGIKAYEPPLNWRNDKSIFSKMTNREIAQKYDVSTSSACSARFRLGMSRLKKDLSFIDQYLGALSDAEIARKFGIKEKAVCYHRRYYKHKNKPV